MLHNIAVYVLSLKLISLLNISVTPWGKVRVVIISSSSFCFVKSYNLYSFSIEYSLPQVTFNGSFDHMNIDATRYCYFLLLLHLSVGSGNATKRFYVWLWMTVSKTWKLLNHFILHFGVQTTRKEVCSTCSRQQKLLEGMLRTRYDDMSSRELLLNFSLNPSPISFSSSIYF